MRIAKGNYGYIRQQKWIRLIRTAVLFAVAIAVFFIGLYLNKGDRRNIYTIIAVVGLIPSSMAAVSMIMMWLRKPMAEDLYRETEQRRGERLVLYELYITTQNKNLYLDASVFWQDSVACFTHEQVNSAHVRFIEQHIEKAMRASGCKRNIKIFQDRRHFMERLDALAGKPAGDPYEDKAAASVLKGIAL